MRYQNDFLKITGDAVDCLHLKELPELSYLNELPGS